MPSNSNRKLSHFHKHTIYESSQKDSLQQSPQNSHQSKNDQIQANLINLKSSHHSHMDFHTPHLLITDLAMHFDDLDELDQGNRKNDEESNKRFLDYYYKSGKNLDIWLLLFLLAIIVPTISILFVYCSTYILSIQYGFIKQGDLQHVVLSLLMSLFLGLSSAFICFYYRDAEGSGIPELKSILAGISIYKYLSLKMMLAKIFGLVLATGSGLTIGREGPFVHISASVANTLSKFRCFKRIHQKNTFRKQILATAGGVGVTATFGAPIGGCLYGIETMSTFFNIGSLWKSYVCAFICATTFVIYQNYLKVGIWATTNFPGTITSELNPIDMICFFILGIISGILGIFHVKLIEWLSLKRKSIKSNFWNRYFFVFFTCSITILITVYYTHFGFDSEHALDNLFNDPDEKQVIDIYTLIGLLFLKMLMNALAISCPVPSGIFVPLYLMGAILGRSYGYVLKFGLGLPLKNIGRFAVGGAAALTSSTTHTLAILVITFEVTGQIKLLYPLLAAVIPAYGISKIFTVSVYHVVIEQKDLPFLPRVLNPQQYRKNAEEIMETNVPYLTIESSFGEIAMILTEIEYRVQSIPIVHDHDSMELLYSVQSANLRDYLNRECKQYLFGEQIPNNKQQKKTNLFRIMGSIPPMYQEYIPADMKELHEIPLSDPFWHRNIDIEDKSLYIDCSPFTVLDTVNVARLHFLFSMLGLHNVFVLSRGRLVGVINKDSFQPKQKASIN